MFVEPQIKHSETGWIEVVCGSMFSGKTEELIRRIRRAQIANLKVEIFKPKVDTRYDDTKVVSHNANAIQSRPVSNSHEIILLADDAKVIGIDEAQFFDENLPEVCEMLAMRGIRVIVAGLDMDFLGNPFGPIPQILAKAEYITKVHAICQVCGGLASHSFRKIADKNKLLLGEKDSYEPRCRACFNKGLKDGQLAL